MKDNTFTLPVDIKKSNYLDEPTVTQNDEITFILQVTDDGEPFDLTQVSTFTLVSMRPDRQSIQTLGIKTGANEATFNLGTSEIAVPGRVSAAIQLYDANGRVSSIPFSYRVLPDLAEGYIPSQNEQTLIELVLGQGPAILAAAQQATANIESLGFISEYDPLITYKKNNIVSYQGGSYIAKSDTTGNLPTNTIHWGKVAEKGEPGIQGIPGKQGIPGEPGKQGIQGIPGQNGTGSGTVTSVNGSQPDVAGNVELIIPNPDLTGFTTKTEFTEHKAEKVHLGEVHGMRANTGKFEYFNGTSWVQVEGGGSGVKPSKVVDLMGVTAVDGKKATLTWKNPTNTEFVRTEIYASAIDITNLDIASVISNSTKIVSSKTLVTSDYPTVHGNLNYFKAYALHTILGNELYSDGVTVSVLSKDTKPPAPITSFEASVDNTTVKLTWVNPVDTDFSKVVIRYADSGFPNDPTTAGTLAYEGSGTTVTLAGLVNGTTYNFRAFTFDTVGNINNDVGQAVSATPNNLDDESGSPGSARLVAGDRQAGYFGTVPASALWTGSALASEVGLSAGVLQYDTTEWLKFSYEGKILFRPMKAFRRGNSWDALNAIGCVFGTKTVVKNGLTYKVRLMKGTMTNPSESTNPDKGAKYSEWNKLMLPIHEQAASKNWQHPQFVEDDVPNWGIGFTDVDLNTTGTVSTGERVWCQDSVGSNSANRIVRGTGGISGFQDVFSSATANYSGGWAPILELVGGV